MPYEWLNDLHSYKTHYKPHQTIGMALLTKHTVKPNQGNTIVLAALFAAR